MKFNFFVFVALFSVSIHASCNNDEPKGSGSFNLSIQNEAGSFQCLIDEEPIGAALSSDGKTVIVSGTGYLPITELSHCKADVPAHVRRAAPTWDSYQT